jgi:VIT1/CCC1 family predicted Fe2+/Mn2+ transporter
LLNPEQPNSQNQKLNWLRAAVLGANDGIVSIAGLVVGVASATQSKAVIITAGVAGVVAGALSMAVGEYVSVSSQRDSEHALLKKQSSELKDNPKTQLLGLAAIYQAKGLSEVTSRQVAVELTAHDAFRAHAEARHGLDPDDLTNPWHAAIASSIAFVSGAAIPMIIVLLPPAAWRVPATFMGVIAALVLTGALSAQAGGAKKGRAMARVVVGGIVAMAITFLIGRLTGVSGV